VRNKSIRVNSELGRELLKNMGSPLDPRIYNRDPSPGEGSRATLPLRSCARHSVALF